jgi:hypothetical protein
LAAHSSSSAAAAPSSVAAPSSLAAAHSSSSAAAHSSHLASSSAAAAAHSSHPTTSHPTTSHLAMTFLQKHGITMEIFDDNLGKRLSFQSKCSPSDDGLLLLNESKRNITMFCSQCAICQTPNVTTFRLFHEGGNEFVFSNVCFQCIAQLTNEIGFKKYKI